MLPQKIPFKNFFSKNLAILAFLFLYLIYLSIGAYQINTNFLTIDETAHIAAAYSYSYSKGDGLNLEHPLFQKLLNSVLFSLFYNDFQPQMPGSKFDQYGLGGEIWRSGDLDGMQVLIYSRWIYLIFNSVFILWLALYTLYFKKIPLKLGLAICLFFIFSPSFFGHNFLATFDVGNSHFVWMSILSLFFLLKDTMQTSEQKEIYLNQFCVAFACLFTAINTKFTAILLLPIFAGSLGVAIFYKFLQKNFRVVTKIFSFSILGFLLIFVLTGLMYLIAFRNVEYKPDNTLTSVQQATKEKAMEGWIGDYTEIKKQVFTHQPIVGKIMTPYLRYIDGLASTFARSREEQAPFLFGKYEKMSFLKYSLSVFWFKENPFLIFIILLIILNFIKEVVNSNEQKVYSKRDIFWWIFLSGLPMVYIFLSSSSLLIIGYRHFYPVLSFIYLFLAYIFVTKFSERIVYLILAGYVLAGLFGLSQSLSYINPFWQAQKWEFTGDSSLNWGQTHGKAYNFLSSKLDLEKDYKQVGIYTFYLVINPVEQAYLATDTKFPDDLNKQIYFDYNKISIKEQGWKYILVDSNFFQNINNDYENNPKAKENLDYINSLEPVWQEDGVIFVFEKK